MLMEQDGLYFTLFKCFFLVPSVSFMCFYITFWAFCRPPQDSPSPTIAAWSRPHRASRRSRVFHDILKTRSADGPLTGGQGSSGRIQPNASTAGVADAVWINAPAAGGLRSDTPPQEPRESWLDSDNTAEPRDQAEPRTAEPVLADITRRRRDSVPGGVPRRGAVTGSFCSPVVSLQ